MRKVIGHTAVSGIQASSVTLSIWQHADKENYCNFATKHPYITCFENIFLNAKMFKVLNDVIV